MQTYDNFHQHKHLHSKLLAVNRIKRISAKLQTSKYKPLQLSHTDVYQQRSNINICTVAAYYRTSLKHLKTAASIFEHYENWHKQ